MKCPICSAELYENIETVYPGRPSYSCLQLEKNELPDNVDPHHYKKFFTADWTYSRYEEYATLFPYRIINYYDNRTGGKHTGMIQRYQKKKSMIASFDRMVFCTILRIDRVISIPNREHFESKIKTILLFS